MLPSRSLSAAGAALVVALAAAPLACGSGSDAERASRDGEGAAAASSAAPDFTLKDLDGREVTLSALRGKTVLLDFWATWCPPCEFQIPILSEFYAAHGADGVEVLGVSVDTAGPDEVREYAEKHGARYPILLGDEALARQFGAPGFPSLVVVAPDGAIRAVHVGLIELPELEKAVAAARGGAAPAAPEPAPPES